MGRKRGELTPPIRVHPVRSHITLYQIEDQNILIVRVPHAHWDRVRDPV
ncbi:type II toxin-antitoxin system RelE/ParE family toxin [Rhodobacteraceae bacterium B1Z28]|uniref:Type II toxin-antitoxin system RelE/ParE family toxin n=1 Tax=Ruegeria haliotis TaxID=2747601 RepID=A0ABX2PJJ6_9RHOB|nr:type II toxin-antitoxin system RelE/ParE family toxin [Ruegeria haliotis]NVO54198.1 type II toxin-antitoxin system RelE/ParE family toxin [Ruegeria haliotis]